jgi:hypothetical protein
MFFVLSALTAILGNRLMNVLKQESPELHQRYIAGRTIRASVDRLMFIFLGRYRFTVSPSVKHLGDWLRVLELVRWLLFIALLYVILRYR